MAEERYTDSFRAEIRKKVLKHIKTGTSLSVLGMPGLGKTDFVSYLVQSCNDEENNVSCVSIDINDLVTISELGFFRHLLTILIDLLYDFDEPSPKVKKQIKNAEERLSSKDPLIMYNTTKRTLDVYLSESPSNLGLFIDGFRKLQNLPTSFFNSLRALRAVNKFKFSYIFVDDVNLAQIYDQEKIGDLYDLVTNIMLWIPLPSREEADKIMENCATLFGAKLKKEQKDSVWENTRGHASLTKYTILYMVENDLDTIDPAEAVMNSAIKARIQKILNSLTEGEFAVIDLISHGTDTQEALSDFEEDVRRLLRSGIVEKKDDGSVEVFSPLISAYVLKTTTGKKRRKAASTNNVSSSSRILLDNGDVFIDGTIIDADLTKTEHDILKYMIKHANTIVTRDDIAEIMWPGNVKDRYSDWAIDRSISRLRKKLGDNAYSPKYIKTLRGRGFKLIS